MYLRAINLLGKYLYNVILIFDFSINDICNYDVFLAESQDINRFIQVLILTYGSHLSVIYCYCSLSNRSISINFIY